MRFPDLKSLIIIIILIIILIIIINWAKTFGSCCWVGSKSGFQGEIPSLAVISEELKCCNALCASWHKEIPHKSEGRCRCWVQWDFWDISLNFASHLWMIGVREAACVHGFNSSGFKKCRIGHEICLGKSALVPYCSGNLIPKIPDWFGLKGTLKTTLFQLPWGWAEQAQELPKSTKSTHFSLRHCPQTSACGSDKVLLPRAPRLSPELVPGILNYLRKIQIYPPASLSLVQSALGKIKVTKVWLIINYLYLIFPLGVLERPFRNILGTRGSSSGLPNSSRTFILTWNFVQRPKILLWVMKGWWGVFSVI